jgi:hypothetical protein
MNKLILVIALLAIGACAKASDTGIGDANGRGDANSQNLPPVAPAIVPPDEAADPKEPPSYEVSIASVAAERNKALERCATQPEAVRTQCEQEANAAFSESEAKLQDLRGNKE